MMVIRQSIETSPGSDVEFLLNLAISFTAVILYEPLLHRRLHDNSYSTMNWEKGYEEGIYVIDAYKKRKLLPTKIATDALFRLYINFGEDYLQHKRSAKAINQFIKAWFNKPFSIAPLKKTGKAVLRYLKNE